MKNNVEIINSENKAFKINQTNYYFSENKIPKTKKATDIHIVHNENSKYIFKINNQKNKKEYELIIKTIKKLNETNFKTAKLIYSEYENNKSYFIFEYIKGEKIKKEPIYIEPIANLMNEFYSITNNIEKNKDLSFDKLTQKLSPKANSKILQNIFKQSLIKTQSNKHNKLIIGDINSSNFIKTEKGIYMIDFDEVFFSEIEFDLADFFTDYFDINQNLSIIIQQYKKFLKTFKKHNINIEKIFDYIILILINELTPNAPKEENTHKINTLKFILKNKKIIIKHLN